MSETPAKRARVQFEKETETPGKKEDPPRPAPSTMAFNIITAAVESHPAPIQRLSLSIFHKFSALKNKERQQLLTLSRLAEDTFLPRSARLAFELRASTKVMETPEFTTLTASMADLTLKWKTEAKKAVLTVAQLESKATRAEIVTCAATSALELAKLFLLQRDPTADLTHAPFLVHYAFEKCGDPLFECMNGIDNAATTVDCRGLLAKLRHIFNTDDSTIPSAIQKVIFNTIIGDYTTLLKKLFVENWKSQTTAYKALASECAMDKELKTILDGSATQQAAMAIDVEPTVDPKILRDLIKTQIQSETKKSILSLTNSVKRSHIKLRPAPVTPRHLLQKKQHRGPIDAPRHQRNLVAPLGSLLAHPQTNANSRRNNLATSLATTATPQTTLQSTPATAIRAKESTSLHPKTNRRNDPLRDRRRKALKKNPALSR